MSVSKRTGRRTLLAPDDLLTHTKETYRNAIPAAIKKREGNIKSTINKNDNNNDNGVSSTTDTGTNLLDFTTVELNNADAAISSTANENDAVNLISTPMQLRPRKRLSATPVAIEDEDDDEGNKEGNEIDTTAIVQPRKISSRITKMVKIDFEYIKRLNLFSNDFYTILNVKNTSVATTRTRFDIGLKQNLIQLEKYLDTEPENAFVKARNDRETIRIVVLFGFYVLGDIVLKSIYDTYLLHKYSDLFVETARGIDEARSAIKNTRRMYAGLENDYNRMVNSKMLEIALGVGVNKIVETVVKKRPSSLNRVLINWTNTNANVTVQSLENYFEKYGPINGTVMCNKKPNCAMMEFANANSVIEAIQNEKYYQLTEIQKWTLNNEYKQKIALLLNTLENIEKQHKEYTKRFNIQKNLMDQTI